MAKKKNEELEQEASTVAVVKGVQMPLGAKGKKKNNPSKPYDEEEIYSERIEKQGDEWVVIDPRTGAHVDKASSRDAAREKQRQRGITQKREPGDGPESKNLTKAQKRTVKQRRPKKQKLGLESIKQVLRTLRESSMLSYVFEDVNETNESLWEGFVGKLPREVVMADEGLMTTLESVAKNEARVLARSVHEIKKMLESTGNFVVERQEADTDPDSGDIRMPFSVMIKGPEEKSLLFGIKLDEGKPSVLFPEESRHALNTMMTQESKLLRAELMHIQETILDSFNEVVEACLKRDAYLKEMQNRLSGMVSELNLVETAMLKRLLKKKKGAR